MKFLFDMNLSPSWVEALAEAGIEAVHWSSVGAPDAADGEIADHARSHGWVVVTNDLDFGKLLAADRASLPSVIQLRLGDLRPIALLASLRRVMDLTRSDLESGALVTVGTSRIRVIRLPMDDQTIGMS